MLSVSVFSTQSITALKFSNNITKLLQNRACAEENQTYFMDLIRL